MIKVFSNNFANISRVNFCATPQQPQNTAPTSGDTFVREDKKEIYLKKLDELFPNGELTQIIEEMNNELGIDKPAKINFIGDNDGVVGGGYTFRINQINLSLSDLLGSEYKISGMKNGKKSTLISPSVMLPLFIDKQNGENFIAMQKTMGNAGYDELMLETVTPEEQRKFVIQKIYHELVHSQQHMIMRQTQGIGEKEVIKAWTFKKPKNLVEAKELEILTDKLYESSYWATQQPTKQSIPPNTPKGKLAKVWLEAVRNYPSVDSPEYVKNPIEYDAYKRSYEYVLKKYGAY